MGRNKIVILGSVFLFLILGVAIFFLFFTGDSNSFQDTQTLGLDITDISESVRIGEDLDFTYELINPTKESSDVQLKQEVRDTDGNKIFSLSDTEMIDSNFDNSKSKRLDTSKLSPGTYVLKLILKKGSLIQETTKEFEVIGESNETSPESNETTTESNETSPESNETEEYIPPSECESHTDCDDENICTTNSCENNKCEIQQVTPCCGNGVCESSESSSICSEDCQETETPSELSDAEITNLATEEASTNSGAASQLCASIDNENNKNYCFARIAYIAENSALCSQITDIDMKDNCYLSLATIDSTVCLEIINPIKKIACEAVQ
jgi:hypothetical protein